MPALLKKLTLFFYRLSGWFVSICILLLLLALGAYMWISVWYLDGSKLTLRIPSPGAQIDIEGGIYLVDRDWSFSLPWRKETTSYGIHLHFPYQKSFTCSDVCPQIDIARGAYQISAAGMEGYYDWQGSIEVLPDTVGSFQIPAEAITQMEPFSFAPEIVQQQRDDQATAREALPGTRLITYNPFDRLVYLIGPREAIIYDASKKIRHDLLIQENNVVDVKKSEDGFLLITRENVYSYDSRTSEIEEHEGIRDKKDDYTLLPTGEIKKGEDIVATDSRITGIQVYGGDIILDLSGKYFTLTNN